MLRSLALTTFFLTLDLRAPATAATGLPRAIGYPLAVFFAAAVNLAVVEWRVRRADSVGLGKWVHRPKPVGEAGAVQAVHLEHLGS